MNWVLFFLFSSFFVFNTKLGLWQGFSKRNWQETCMYKWGHSLSAGCWGQCLCPSVNSKYVKVNLTYTFLPPPTHCPYLLSFPSLNNTELQIIQNIWLSHKQKWQHKVNSLGGVEYEKQQKCMSTCQGSTNICIYDYSLYQFTRTSLIVAEWTITITQCTLSRSKITRTKMELFHQHLPFGTTLF